MLYFCLNIKIVIENFTKLFIFIVNQLENMSNIISLDDVKKKKSKDTSTGAKIVTPFGTQSVSSSSQAAKPNTSSHFQGPARTVSGKVVNSQPPSQPVYHTFSPLEANGRTDPLLEDNSEISAALAEYNVPRELSFQFWSLNTTDPSQFTPCYLCKYSFCPCCTGPCCSADRKKDWLKLFKSITFYLIIIQIILYIICISLSKHMSWELDPDISVLSKFGANGYSYLKEYRFYRLLSYIVLHGSLIHILVNSFTQFLFVIPMEAAWGLWRFLIIYISTGIIGGLFSGIRKSSISVGASCSILGVMGGFTILILVLWSQIGPKSRFGFMMWIILMPFEFVATSFLPNVDWLGHLGGYLSGLGITAIIFHRRAQSRKLSFGLLIGGIILTILVIAVPLLIIFFE